MCFDYTHGRQNTPATGNKRLRKFKVHFSGYSLVEAENPQQAESKFENDQGYYKETLIDEVELLERMAN